MSLSMMKDGIADANTFDGCKTNVSLILGNVARNVPDKGLSLRSVRHRSARDGLLEPGR